MAIRFEEEAGPPCATPAGEQAAVRWLRLAEQELQEYFASQRRSFTFPLAAQGTPFQQAVWQAVAAIGYGQTAQYGEIARALGRPQAARAVGAANGSNPLPFVIPCHRVIGANGQLTGYRGGLPAKRFLLQLEGVLAA